MPDFSYLAIDKDGKQVKGNIQSADEGSVRAKLKIDGLTLVSLKRQSMLTKDITIGSGGVDIISNLYLSGSKPKETSSLPKI